MFKTNQQLGMWLTSNTLAINTIKITSRDDAKCGQASNRTNVIMARGIEPRSKKESDLQRRARSIGKHGISRYIYMYIYFVAEGLKLSTTSASISGSFRSSSSFVISSRPSVRIVRMREQQVTSTDQNPTSSATLISCI